MVARKGRIAVPDWYQLDRAGEWLVQLYQARGKPVKAAEWRKKLPVSTPLPVRSDWQAGRVDNIQQQLALDRLQVARAAGARCAREMRMTCESWK
jgi:hypothetical protein